MNEQTAGATLDLGGLALDPETAELAAVALNSDGTGLNWQWVESGCGKETSQLSELRHLYRCTSAALHQLFIDQAPVDRLVRDRARIVDQLIVAAWRREALAELSDTALIAVGGYGRGELHPHSDVDLLILVAQSSTKNAADPVARFLALLWDIGLEVGHSTRTLKDCKNECRGDLSTVTTLLESRLLIGPSTLQDAMRAAIGPENMWSSRSFFEAKLKEQQARHANFDDTAYNLEPNVKGAPGGLRDIQTVAWVAQRRFGTERLADLVTQNFLNPHQLALIEEGRDFLWKIRFALHVLTGRREDRLLFDHQSKLANFFGYQDGRYILAVEQFMQRYYRTVMELSRLNEMLLQRFQETILMNPDAPAEAINERFQVRNGFLQIADDRVFQRQPSALLELFVLLEQHAELKGVSASTITAIKRDLVLINDEFRQDPRNQELFMQIISAPAGVTHELRRMNLYGVLGLYIPAFGRIVGRMQYDLFHAYTVDAHTLFVVSNLRRFALTRFDHEFPHCSDIMQNLPNTAVAYLAGLFHDIAKGRGGDHSQLGAADAEAFCLEHGMSRYDARLVAWLVRHHLLLSLTAQKKDISDPTVIQEFAEIVGDEIHLDYLYVLTIADVRATNPKLWNSWRAQLFQELRRLTRRALRRGLADPVDKQELVKERRTAAKTLLRDSAITDAEIESTWTRLSEEYFLRCRPEEIAAHSLILADPANAQRTVLVDVQPETASGGTAVFIFSPQRYFSFAMATAVMDELGFSIADARIIPLPEEMSLSTYVVLEADGSPIDEVTRIGELHRRLSQAMARDPDESLQVKRRAPRQVRMFSTPTLVNFELDDRNNRTMIEIITGDQPGILCEVGKILRKHRLAIQTAKIMTVGERAEDVFYVTTADGKPIAPEHYESVQADLIEALDKLA